ncbi:MAG: MFS transporter [Ardenticatenaceae bacterium]|nr:MFS transporter [Ardenticatenaceae bacterium]
MNVTLTKRLPTAVLLIAFTHFALELHHNFLPVVYPLLIEKMGLTYSQIGTLALVVSISGALTQPLFGYVSDRWDPRLMVAGSIGWIGLWMGLFGVVAFYGQQYWLLIPIIVLGSFASAAYHPAGAALIPANTTTRRGMAMSLFSVGGNLGSALSPLIVSAGLLWFGLRGTAVLVPLGLVISLFLFSQSRQLALPKHTAVKGSESQTGSWLALGLIVLVVAARSWFQGSLATYLPEWLLSEGRPLETASSIFSVLLVSLSVGSISGGTLSDKVGRVPIIVGSMLLMGPLHWLMLHSSGLSQIALIALTGVTIGASFPVTILMAQEIWPQATGLAGSLVMGLGWLPAGIGSWVVGLIADNSSLTAGLQTLIFVPLVGVTAVLLFKWRFDKTS